MCLVGHYLFVWKGRLRVAFRYFLAGRVREGARIRRLGWPLLLAQEESGALSLARLGLLLAIFGQLGKEWRMTGAELRGVRLLGLLLVGRLMRMAGQID